MKLSRNALLALGAIAAFYLYSRYGGQQGSTPDVDDPDAGSFDPGDIVTDVYAETVGAVTAMVSGRTPSNAAIATIQAHEYCKLTAYFDVKGYSIGWGHFGVAAGTVWTQAEADSQLLSDVAAAGSAVNKYISVPLNQNQFDALVDFVYALGAGALAGSTLRRVLNAGNYDAVPGELVRWQDQNGVPNAQVLARRQAEVETWNTPDDSSSASSGFTGADNSGAFTIPGVTDDDTSLYDDYFGDLS